MNSTLLLLLVGAGAFLWYKNKTKLKVSRLGENAALLKKLEASKVTPRAIAFPAFREAVML